MDHQRIILDGVPYFSQRTDVQDPFWQTRSCGIVALKMAMDFMGDGKVWYRAPSLETLLAKGEQLRARDPRHGWVHDGLVALAKSYGFEKSFRKEWRESYDEAFAFFRNLIVQRTPALLSFTGENGSGGHLVLGVGVSSGHPTQVKHPGKRGEGVVVVHDPDQDSLQEGAFREIPEAVFRMRWKQRMIVVAI